MATAITLKKSLEPTHVHVGAAAAARLHLAHLRKVGEQATTTGIHLSHVLIKSIKAICITSWQPNVKTPIKKIHLYNKQAVC